VGATSGSSNLIATSDLAEVTNGGAPPFAIIACHKVDEGVEEHEKAGVHRLVIENRENAKDEVDEGLESVGGFHKIVIFDDGDSNAHGDADSSEKVEGVHSLIEGIGQHFEHSDPIEEAENPSDDFEKTGSEADKPSPFAPDEFAHYISD